MPDIIPPRFDAMFKRIFGNPNNPERLQSFLRTILDIPADDLDQLSFIDTHLHPPYTTASASMTWAMELS